MEEEEEYGDRVKFLALQEILAMDMEACIRTLATNRTTLQYVLVHWHAGCMDVHDGLYRQIHRSEADGEIIAISPLPIDSNWRWDLPYEPLFGPWCREGVGRHYGDDETLW